MFVHILFFYVTPKCFCMVSKMFPVAQFGILYVDVLLTGQMGHRPTRLIAFDIERKGRKNKANFLGIKI